MDEKNRNISDTFGKYNNSTGEVKNVSSSDWTPISTGGSFSSGQTQSPAKKTQSNKKSSAKSGAKSSGKSQQKKGQTSNKNGAGHDFISQGPPSQKSKAKKTPDNSKKGNGKNASQAKKNSQKPDNRKNTRTPSGRDLRDDAKKQQKHNENLAKNREQYKKRSEDGLNHDEYCRQQNAGKRKKNAVKNAVTVGVVLLFALFFILVFCYNQGALIENVVIKGETVYTDEQILEAAGIVKGKKMLSLREDKVRKDITTKLPYIKEVIMECELPDTLILTVSATRDKYVISSANGWVTLDSGGKVVDLSRQTLESGMYRAEGFDYQELSIGDTYEPEEGNAERYELLKKIVTLLERGGEVESAVINLKNMEDVRIIYDEKIAVYLGDCENLEEKIPSASAIIAQVKPKKLSGYIDLRYDPPAFKQGSMEIE